MQTEKDNKLTEIPTYSLEELIKQWDYPESKRLGTELLMVDNFVHNPDERIPLFRQPSKMDAIAIMLCMEGSGRFTVNMKDIEIHRGSLVAIPPYSIIHEEQVGNYMATGIIASINFIEELHIPANEMISFFLKMCDNYCFHLTEADIEDFRPEFAILRKVLQLNQTYKQAIISHITQTMLYQIAEISLSQVPDITTTDPNSIFRRFMLEVTEYHNEQRSVEYYASKLNLTPKYFSKVILESSGKKASEWISDFVIHEAKALLKYSDLSVQEIAYRLHFPNQSFFGKYFKRIAGMSPNEYRRSKR